MKIEVQGTSAIAATEELLALEGIEGSYQSTDAPERGEVLVTIATIVAIVGGTLTIAEKLYQWHQKYQKSQQDLSREKIEKVLLIAPNGNRLLLKDATLEQIQHILEESRE